MPALIDKQLILHAGTHKTGTTAIQDSLARHAEFLGGRGFSQAVLHRDLRDLHRAFNPKAYGLTPAEIDLEALREEFRAWARQQEGDKLIISGEALSHCFWEDWGQEEGVGPYLFEGFASQNIVLYIRRQDRFIESAYQELLKHGLAQTFEEYCQAPASNMYRVLDWRSKIGKLISLYPEARVVVRLFDRAREKGDIFRDFLEVVGLSELPSEILSEKENPGLDAARMELLRVCNKHRTALQRQVLLKLFAQQTELPTLPSPHRRFLLEEQRRELLATYHESNASLFAEHGLGNTADLDAWEAISQKDRQDEEIAPAADEDETLALVDRLCAEAADEN
ncbi:MAG: hypothetical protein ACYTG5_20685 [Planctomycetota bacterium]|jgi:hypothetical protein